MSGSWRWGLVGCRAAIATGILALVALSAVTAAEPPVCIWLEAEKPEQANFEIKPWSGDNPQIFSAGQWFTHTIAKNQVKTALPPDGLSLRYSFEAPEIGVYEFWARLGYEGVRAPLEWRVDGGPWQTIRSDRQTTNLMEVGLWCEVAWVKAGTVNLQAGKHALEIRYSEPGPDGRLLIALDCLAFSKGAGSFVPEGALQPGQEYEEPIDKQARQQVYRFQGEPSGSPSRRLELPLDGLWEIARYDDPDMDKETYEPVRRIPTAAEYPLRWMGIAVPGNTRRRAELRMAHRVFFRTRVEVPAELAGRGFHLHFSGTCWIAGVLVNGRYCGGRESVLVPWDADVTEALKPGEINEIVVSVKSGWYAMDPKPRDTSIDQMRNIPESHLRWSRFVDAIYPSSKGEGRGTETGIVNPVKLVVTGPAYTAGMFIRTSVAKKHLEADVTVSNPAGEPANLTVTCEAVHEKTGRVEKTFGPAEVTVPARGSKDVRLAGDWADPKLWWPEEDAELYVMRTTLAREGKPIDVHEELFGFREVSIEGRHFLLNGIRWHFWNWVDVGRAAGGAEWLRQYHAQNDRFHRIASDHDRLFGHREEALEFHNRHGIPGRLSTCVDGMFITHDVNNPLVWENFAEHTRQVVTAYRNNPCIMMWSLGNELMFITCRLANFGHYREMEEKAAALSRIARELDPTRPSFQDGGGDLGGLIGVNCQHYSLPRGEEFPGRAYAYRLLDEGPIMPRPREPGALYMWDGNKPLVLGEVFYHAGNVSKMAWIGGPDVFRGKPFADRAAARYARMVIEGARWQDVTGICPWVRGLPGAERSYSPRAVFVREYNRCFLPGQTMKRTIRVFNDGRKTDPLTLKWHLTLDEKEVDRGEKTYRVPPGQHQADLLAARLPAGGERKDGRLWLELYAGSEPVFQDSRPIAVLPPASSAFPGLDEKSLYVYETEQGKLRRWFRRVGQSFSELDSTDDLPDTAKVIVIGPGALSKANKKALAAKLRRFVTAGNTLIVLEQGAPLEGDDLPVPGIEVAGPEQKQRVSREEFRQAGGHSGAISFPVAPAHPALDDLKPEDFFTWAGDEMNFRLSYATPATGAISIIQAGNELGLTPMMELPVGQGSYLLSQMAIGEKLGIEPVADRLLANLLRWAAARGSAKPGKTLAFLAGDQKLAELVAKTGVAFQNAAAVAETLSGDVAVVRATPENLDWLDKNKAQLTDFCNRGGWLMLAGLDPAGIDSFNRLVGFRHRIRPFRREAVTLDNRTDRLLLGLSDRDASMKSDEMLAPWAHLYWVSDRVFSAVVDGEEIASFGGNGTEIAQVTNGLTNEDFWRYIQYLDAGGASIAFDFGRPETITAVRIKPTAAPYYFLKDVEITFDDNTASPVKFTCRQEEGLQDVPLGSRTASKVTVHTKDHYPAEPTKNLVGIDLLEIDRRMPAGSAERVVLLARPGGLVKYPIGPGGIVLNQLDTTRPDTAENIKKKLAIYANLLRNMGASFSTSGRQ